MSHDPTDRDGIDQDGIDQNGIDQNRLQLVLFGAALGPLVLTMVLLLVT